LAVAAEASAGSIVDLDAPRGGTVYASAQPLNFLARTKNVSFPNRKLLVFRAVFPDENEVDDHAAGSQSSSPA
jgi:hypothetical protein